MCLCGGGIRLRQRQVSRLLSSVSYRMRWNRNGGGIKKGVLRGSIVDLRWPRRFESGTFHGRLCSSHGPTRHRHTVAPPHSPSPPSLRHAARPSTRQRPPSSPCPPAKRWLRARVAFVTVCQGCQCLRSSSLPPRVIRKRRRLHGSKTGLTNSAQRKPRVMLKLVRRHIHGPPKAFRGPPTAPKRKACG